MENEDDDLILFRSVAPKNRPLDFSQWTLEEKGYGSFDEFVDDMKQYNVDKDIMNEIMNCYYEEYEEYCNELGFICGSLRW